MSQSGYDMERSLMISKWQLDIATKLKTVKKGSDKEKALKAVSSAIDDVKAAKMTMEAFVLMVNGQMAISHVLQRIHTSAKAFVDKNTLAVPVANGRSNSSSTAAAGGGGKPPVSMHFRSKSGGAGPVADAKEIPKLDKQGERLLAELDQQIENVFFTEGKSDPKAQLLESICREFKNAFMHSPHHNVPGHVKLMLEDHARDVERQMPSATNHEYTVIYLQAVNDFVEELAKSSAPRPKS